MPGLERRRRRPAVYVRILHNSRIYWANELKFVDHVFSAEGERLNAIVRIRAAIAYDPELRHASMRMSHLQSIVSVNRSRLFTT